MATVSPWIDRSTASEPSKPKFPNQEVLRRRYKWWTFLISSLNLLAITALVVVCLHFSENWWLSGALIYLPQTPLVIPSVCLLGCSLMWHLRSALLNLTSIGLILVCLCDAQFSMKPFHKIPDTGRNVRLITCNVQNFEPNFGQVLREVSRFKPDVLVLQEARQVPKMLKDNLEGWNWRHQAGLMVGSKWSLSEGKLCHTSPYDRPTAMAVQIETPSGTIMVGNLHLMTARRGLTALSVTSILDGSGPASVDHHAFLRDKEARQTQDFFVNLTGNSPTIIAGDFNMPTTSSIFDHNFGQYSNAFDEAGVGFGYTAPCRPVRFWLPEVPWLRIDHILTSSHFETLQCEAGKFSGSDHRLVTALLKLRATNAPQP